MDIDKLKRFPSQDLEKRPTECSAEVVADILGNECGTPLDPGFIYANTLRLQGISPTTAVVAKPVSAMQAPIVWGCLPTDEEPFDATTTSELYEANWKNYPADNFALAKNFTASGIIPLYTYQDIISYLRRYNMGVKLTVRWYSNFNTPNPDGTLPLPIGTYSIHDVAVYDAPLKGLQIKPLEGPNYGDHGYGYMSQTIFNQVFQEAYGFDPFASRWWSLASIGVTHPKIILSDILPQLSHSS